MKSVQEKIRDIRLQKGFTQEYMASEIGISQRQYGRLENEESDMAVTHLQEICKVLRINPQELFDNEIKQENHN